MINEQELKNRFLASVNIEEYKHHKLARPIVLSFIASTGAGKTHISNLLSKEFNIPIFDNDGIRRFLNEQGIDGPSPLPELVIDIARTRMVSILENGISYILDADLTLTYKEDIKRIGTYGSTLLLIQIESPEEVAIQRIRERLLHNTTASRADEAKYYEREEKRREVLIDQNDIFFTIYATEPLEQQLDELYRKLRSFLNSA